MRTRVHWLACLTLASSVACRNHLLAPSPSQLNVFANGSFEAGLSDWSASGHVKVLDDSSVYSATDHYAATDGHYMAVFSAGQTTPDGRLSQRVATVAGTVYTVTFDYGAASALNQSVMRVQVAVVGATPVAQQTFTIAATAPPPGTHWASGSLPFTADGETATLSFQDVSTQGMDTDLVLDHVQVFN